MDSLSHQLWDSGEIPIGITDMNLPKVSRQDGQTRVNLEARAVPMQQGLNGEAMAKIVQARPMACRRATQSNLPRQGMEGAVHVADVQPIAGPGHEQMRSGTSGEESAAMPQIIGQDV